eukprot:XP_014773837.1 PREDICTED: uncharacterized protein LOC106871705 [Octopus bimaculoides]
MPFPDMHPHTITLPPTCLIVGWMHSGLYSSPICLLTYFLPSLLNKLNFGSSDHNTFDQSVGLQFKCSFVNCIQTCQFFKEIYGFLQETLPRSPNSLRRFFMVDISMQQ